MGASAGASRPSIPWHRRLEARVLLAVTVIAGLSLATVAFITARVVSNHTFDRAQRDLKTARAAFTHLMTTRAEFANAQSDLIIELPVFRAHMLTTELASDRATMAEMTSEYCRKLSAAFCVVTSATGRWLASPGTSSSAAMTASLDPVIRSALDGLPVTRIVGFDGGLFLVLSRPAKYADEVVGTLISAYRLDDDLARRLAQITRTQVAFVVDRRISGSSLDSTARRALGNQVHVHPSSGRDDVTMWDVGGVPFVGGMFSLGAGADERSEAGLILLEEWKPTEQFIDDIVRQLAWAGALVFALGTIGSVALSRRMSRPLREIAERAAEIASGEWERRVPVRGSAEAVAMADAFNDMTHSLSHWHAQARQRAEQLQAAYERYAAVTNSAADAIVSTDADGTIMFWNRSAGSTFGYAEELALGTPLLSLFADPHLASCTRAMAAVTTDDGVTRTFDAEGVRHDGSSFPCELTMASWKAGGATFLTTIIRDITERRRAEEALHQRDAQLRQAQKMEAIGRLASGVAHDFNNALAVIQGYTEQMLMCLGETHEHHDDLQEVLKASHSAASLTRQLLAFSRRQAIEPQVLSLSEVIGNVQKMLGRLVGEEIELRTDLMSEDDLVHADRGQLEQIVVNLCVNARDAMPDGGRVDVAVRRTAFVDDAACSRLGVPRGDYLTLSVRDTGHGMDPATAARVFEPFFTTKEPGKGTGLGLAMVYSIVVQSGGAIELETAPGRGTSFHVHLPAAMKESVEDDGETEGDSVLSGSETVLLVEDEEPVRAILRKSLHSAGYVVIEAGSGTDALALSRSHRGDIHVMLTDVVMPGMNGLALADAVSQERPNTSVVFMSGHAADTMARYGFDAGTHRFLQKPFSAQTLCSQLRDALTRRSPPPD